MKDPVMAVSRLLSLDLESVFNDNCFAKQAQDLKQEQKLAVKCGKEEMWRGFYRKALLFSFSLLEKCNISSENLNNKEKKEIPSRLNIPLAKSSVSAIERETGRVFNYYRERLGRQKDIIVSELYKFMDDDFFYCSRENRSVKAEISEEWFLELEAFYEESIEKWEKSLFLGLAARLDKKCSFYEDELRASIGKSSLEFFEKPSFTVEKNDDFCKLKKPSSKKEKLISLPAGIMKFLRSQFGMIFMFAGILSSIPFISTSRGNMMMLLIPFAMFFAVLNGIFEVKQSKSDALKKSIQRLRTETEKKINDTMETQKKRMDGILKKYESDYLSEWGKWTFRLLNSFDKNETSSPCSFDKSGRETKLGYLKEDVEKRIIPEIKLRLETLEMEKNNVFEKK
jgi:hypothetical protein